jgi:hypothetical protein
MNRRVTTQDISWFLDLHRNGQLDLDPPYQRRSVWTLKDRKYFLDTIFRGYPCPAIFLHKSSNEEGKQIYHVVDGKQRLETIIKFVNNDISIDSDFGDVTLSGKKWRHLEETSNSKKKLWDYVLSVEFIDTVEGTVINEVFARINRNAQKLQRQELRHAKYDGWFINKAETESIEGVWEELGVVSKARIKRMKDVQFISELLIVLLNNRIDGFDQDYIDSVYANYDSMQELTDFSEEDFIEKLACAKNYIRDACESEPEISAYTKGFGNFFSLWAFVVLKQDLLPSATELAGKYKEFMKNVETLKNKRDPEQFLAEHPTEKDIYIDAYRYFRNSVGASTDISPRNNRHEALVDFLLNTQ